MSYERLTSHVGIQSAVRPRVTIERALACKESLPINEKLSSQESVMAPEHTLLGQTSSNVPLKFSTAVSLSGIAAKVNWVIDAISCSTLWRVHEVLHEIYLKGDIGKCATRCHSSQQSWQCR